MPYGACGRAALSTSECGSDDHVTGYPINLNSLDLGGLPFISLRGRIRAADHDPVAL